MTLLALLLAWLLPWTLQAQLHPFPGPGRRGVAGGGGPVAFDAVASSKCGGGSCGGTSSALTLTYALTVGAGANRGLAVGVCVAGPSAVVQPATSSVTYAGVGLVSKKKQGTNYYCELWSLPDGTQPSSGTNNVVVTLASILAGGADVIASVAISATGVNQTTAWTATNGTGGSGVSALTTLTSSGASDMGVHFECNGTSVSTTVGSGETSRAVTATDVNGACNTMGGATAIGGDTAFSRTVGNDSWIMIGGALKAAP